MLLMMPRVGLAFIATMACCSACCLPEFPDSALHGSSLVINPQCTCCRRLIPSKCRKSESDFFELQKVPISPPLQLVEVALNMSPDLQLISHSPLQSGVICGLLKGALILFSGWLMKTLNVSISTIKPWRRPCLTSHYPELLPFEPTSPVSFPLTW